MNNIDCRGSWKIKQTSQGNCLELNTNDVYNEKLKSLKQSGKQRLPRDVSGLFGDRFKANIKKALEHFVIAPRVNEIDHLNLVIGFNKSDNTFGWNEFNNAVNLHYLDHDENFIGSSHKIALEPTLNPTITFTQMVSKKLGKPFTSCNPDPKYTPRNCQIHEYMAKVLDKCGCYPR